MKDNVLKAEAIVKDNSAQDGCKQGLFATHATTLFYVPCVVASSRSSKSCNEGLLRTIANEQDFFSTRGTRGQTSLIACGSVLSVFSTDEGNIPYSDS